MKQRTVLSKPARPNGRARFFLGVTMLASAGCVWFRPPEVPIGVVQHAAPARIANGVVVLLPGIGDGPADFVQHGFVDEVRAQRSDLDIVAVDANIAYYVHEQLVERLHADVLGPLRERYEHVWLVGISLGGLGAMAYDAAHPGVVDAVVLLAPYLGRSDVLREVRAAGGAQSWTPPATNDSDDPMRRLAYTAWRWARDAATRGDDAPYAFLGFGESDRFRAGQVLLARALPVDHVLTVPGAHDWKAWRSLFGSLFARALRAVDDEPRAPTARSSPPPARPVAGGTTDRR